MQEFSCYTLMEKNTLSNYGLILVAALIIAAMLVVFSPVSPFGFSETIRTAFNDAIDKYISKTDIEVVQPDNTTTELGGLQTVNYKITIKHILSTGQEYKVEKDSATYGQTYNISEHCLEQDTEIIGYKVSYCPSNKVIVKDETFEIKYSPVNYNITYNLDGGTILSTPVSSYKYGDAVIYPQIVTRPGFTFVGWYTTAEKTGSPVYELPSGTYGNITLYAKWTDIPLSISYYIDGKKDTSLAPNVMIYGDVNQVDLPKPDEKEGFIFDGWYTTNNYTGPKHTKTPVNPTKDIIYYGKYVNNQKYTIKYELNDGMFTSTKNVKTEYTEGMSVILPDASILYKKGHTFGGWYLEPNCSDETLATDIKEGDTGNYTFYAKWIPNQYSIQYWLEKGSLTDPMYSYTYSTQKIALPEPVREGYDFIGWTPSTNKNQLWFEIPAENTGNLSLTASWTPSTFRVTYDVDGKDNEYLGAELTDGINTLTKNIKYDSVYDFTGLTPTYEHHEFVGWFTEEGTEITNNTVFKNNSDIILYAKFVLKKYPVEYIFIDYNTGNELVYNTEDSFVDSEDGGKEINPDKFTAVLLEHVMSLPTELTINEKLNIDELTAYNDSFTSRYTVDGFTTGKWHNKNGDVCDATTTCEDILDNGVAKIYCDIQPNTFSYFITLEGGEAVGLLNQGQYTYGDALELPVPTKSGFAFVGWSITSLDIQDDKGENLELASIENTGSNTFTPNNIHGNISITAVWGVSEEAIDLKVYLNYNNSLVTQNGEEVYTTIHNVVFDELYEDSDFLTNANIFENTELESLIEEFYIPTTYSNITFVDGDATGGDGITEEVNGNFLAHAIHKNNEWYIEVKVERYLRFKVNLVDELGNVIDMNKFEKQFNTNTQGESITDNASIVKFRKTDDIVFQLATNSNAYMYQSTPAVDVIYSLTTNKTSHTYKINDSGNWNSPVDIQESAIGIMNYKVNNTFDSSADINIYIKYITINIDSTNKHNISYSTNTVLFNGTSSEFNERETVQENQCTVQRPTDTISYATHLPDYYVDGYDYIIPTARRHCQYKFEGWAYKSGSTYKLIVSTREIPSGDVTLYSVWSNCPEEERIHSYSEPTYSGCSVIYECEFCGYKDIYFDHAWTLAEEEIITEGTETYLVSTRTCNNCSATETIKMPFKQDSEHQCLHSFTNIVSTEQITIGNSNLTRNVYNCSGCQGCGNEDVCQDSVPCGAVCEIIQPTVDD